MATFELESFLRTVVNVPHTVAGIGPGTWDRHSPARSQDTASISAGALKTRYRLYTEDVHRNATLNLVRRYFEGATVVYGIGMDARTQEADENAVVIEIVTTKADAFQRVIDLAGDIRECNSQISVLITRDEVRTFEVTARAATHGEL